MSSNHTLFTKLALLLVMVGALALAGCGGGDSGLSAADQARIDQAEIGRQAEADKAAQAEIGRLAEADKAAQAEIGRLAEADKATQAEIGRLAEADKATQAEIGRLAAEQKAEAAAKELVDVQTAAAAAAAAAKTASDAAAVDAKTAMDATANIATLQTGEMSKAMAYEAKMAADGAMTAYMAAKKASETAAEATTTEDATEAKVMAVAEQAKADMYAMTADEKSKGAVKYAMTELMIDDKNKSDGESMLNAGDGRLSTTDEDDMTTVTGRLMTMDPMYTADAETGAVGTRDDPAAPKMKPRHQW